MLLTSQVLFAPFLRLHFQPEIIAEQQGNGGQCHPDQHPPAFARFPVGLRGLFSGVLGAFGGGLG